MPVYIILGSPYTAFGWNIKIPLINILIEKCQNRILENTSKELAEEIILLGKNFVQENNIKTWRVNMLFSCFAFTVTFSCFDCHITFKKTIFCFYINWAYFGSLLHLIIACIHLPFFKMFSKFVHFCPNFLIFCPFLTFFDFFWKITPIPLLSRISPG